MEFIDIISSVGFPAAMVAYFIRYTTAKEKAFSAAEKDNLERYSQLTREVTGVVTTYQNTLGALVSEVKGLTAAVSGMGRRVHGDD